jgi:rhodanese-related sulfurtransferase
MDFIQENLTSILFVAFFLTMIFKGKIMAKIYGINNVSAQQLKDVIDKSHIELVDVRTPAEYNQGHVSEAINLPLQQLTSEQLEKKIQNKNAPVYLICASGNRSLWASINLKKWGFTNVNNVSGGMMMWNHVNK